MAGRPTKILTKEDILRAQKVTRSNMSAARYLSVSYLHYKKYAEMYKNDEGVTLLEAHKNQSGGGIPFGGGTSPGGNGSGGNATANTGGGGGGGASGAGAGGSGIVVIRYAV